MTRSVVSTTSRSVSKSRHRPKRLGPSLRDLRPPKPERRRKPERPKETPKLNLAAVFDVLEELQANPSALAHLDHYELLGILPNECDRPAVDDAFKKLNAAARPYQTGKLESQCKAYIELLTKAYTMLSNDNSRAEYNQAVGIEITPRKS